MRWGIRRVFLIIFYIIVLGITIFTFSVFLTSLIELINTYTQNILITNLFIIGRVIIIGIIFLQLCYLLLSPLFKRTEQIASQMYVIIEGKKLFFNGKELRVEPKRRITSISQIKRLGEFSETLINLNLSDHQIKNIEGLPTLNYLQTLTLRNNQIDRIEILDNVKSLISLDLSGNNIKKIEGLEPLKELRVLDLKKNQIEKIESLENLPNLNNLDLRKNNLKSLEGVRNLYSLEILRVDDNELEEIHFIETLVNLKQFSWRKNPLKYNSVRPRSAIGKYWTRYCQINTGPSVIPKLKNLKSEAKHPEKLEKRIVYLEDFFKDQTKIESRKLKKKRPDIKRRIKYGLNKVRKYIRHDLETPWKLIFFFLFVIFGLFPWLLEIAVLLDPNIRYEWDFFFIIRSLIVFSAIVFILILYGSRIKRDFLKDLRERKFEK